MKPGWQPKGPPWWRPLARWRWRRALELPADMPRRLANLVGTGSAVIGLERTGDCSAAAVALPDGRLIPLETFWREVEPTQDAIFVAAGEMLELIAGKHGPGRVWGLPNLEIVHLIYDDGVIVKLDRRNRPMVRLRAAYHHEAATLSPELD